MIINEVAGSGGDMMPWMFRYTKTGTLVGKRTWGGLIGVLGFPLLMDGGTVTAPNVRIFSPSGEWIAENTGVAPDVEVDLDPKSVSGGHDPQLERAVNDKMRKGYRYALCRSDPDAISITNFAPTDGRLKCCSCGVSAAST